MRQKKLLNNDWFDELEELRDRHYELFSRSPVYSPLGDGISALQLIDIMGRDLSVANDARSSFDRVSLEFSPKDAKLIDYLADAEPKHTSPFRGCTLKFRITAPLPVCRQWWKHVVASTHIDDQIQHNEVSYRYSELLEPKFYQPEKYRSQATTNRQASGDCLEESANDRARQLVAKNQQQSYEAYKELIGIGVSREQARESLVQGTYTTWVWTVSLQALLAFLELRKGAGAQTEIVLYAKQLEKILRKTFPTSAAAWLDEKPRHS